jgi:hypothetical protein
MKRLTWLVAICLAAAWGLLWFGDLIFLIPGAVGVGLFALGLRRRLVLLVQAGFLVLVLTAAFSTWNQGRELALLTSVCASLAAWDLSSYLLMLRFVGDVPEGKLTRRRLLRLGGILLGGWGLGAAALASRLELGFGAILLLGLCVVVGVAVSIMILRRHDENSW